MSMFLAHCSRKFDLQFGRRALFMQAENGDRTMSVQGPIATVMFSMMVVVIASCATATVATEPVVPEALKVAPSQKLLLKTSAEGFQIYRCNVSSAAPTGFEWAFVAPEANLFDSSGKKIGKHYAGPTWELNDGSKVVGEVRAKDDGPDAGAIPWLLLAAKSGPGAGMLGQVQAIQRIATVGGRAPASGCNAEREGQEARVGYKASYYFYVAQP
jgi:hypothetical protein